MLTQDDADRTVHPVGGRRSGAFTDKQIDAARDLRRPGRHRHRERPAVHELQARNRELTEALEQQTATGEILASSPLARPTCSRSSTPSPRARSGCATADRRVVFRFDGELIHSVASYNGHAGGLVGSRRAHPAAAQSTQRAGRAILERRDRPHPRHRRPTREYRPGVRRTRRGVRSGRSVPMLRDGDAVGVIIVDRPRSGPFTDAADRPARDLRRPGRHRHRERAAVHGAAGQERATSPRRWSSRRPPPRSCA